MYVTCMYVCMYDCWLICVFSVCGDVGYDAAQWAVWYKFKINGDVIVSQYLTGELN